MNIVSRCVTKNKQLLCKLVLFYPSQSDNQNETGDLFLCIDVIFHFFKTSLLFFMWNRILILNASFQELERLLATGAGKNDVEASQKLVFASGTIYLLVLTVYI